MKIPLEFPRAKYLPASLINEWEHVSEIPDAPTLLDVLPKFGFARPKDPIDYEIPEIIHPMPLFLLPHQQKAIRRLFHGGILSDAPRMGKTVTAIGWTHVQKAYHPEWDSVTIICPAVLIPQWRTHVEKYGDPSLRYTVISMDAERFVNATDMLIIDEARHFKHEETERYQKVLYTHRKLTLCLEATPLSDRGSDIYALLHLVRDHWFPTKEQFIRWYVLEISKYEPLIDYRILSDTQNLWVWRKKQTKRPRTELQFEDEKNALEYVKELPRPLVIFTDTRKRAESIAKKLGGASVLTGDYKLSERGDNVRQFQAGEIDLLVCTFWAAGEGIDLSNAKNCVVFGYDWTPATIEQAIARTDHIDPKRAKADVYTCLWPGEVKYKNAIAQLKEFYLPDWAEDISAEFEWKS